MANQIPKWLHQISYQQLIRVDIGLEGNWNPSVVTVWTKKDGIRDYSQVIKKHQNFKPSLELYFPDSWFGIHCFYQTEDGYLFDQKFADEIIDFVEQQLDR